MDLTTDFAGWKQQLRELAREQELEWAVGADVEAHRAAYEAGLSPAEELASLADMGQWRGCGCGGG